jgi:glycosyltransferase involved in cell wall biosynthesis
VARLPMVVGQSIAALGVNGAVTTMLRLRSLHQARHKALVEFLDGADRVVAVSGWLRDVLLANGVPQSKLLLCRHGVTQAANLKHVSGNGSRGIRLAFLGRLSPIKGVDVIVAALKRRPKLAVCLDCFVVVQEDSDYIRDLKRQIDDDPRIRLLPALPNDQVVETLSGYDALLVPSQWMETGPLVVYDAFLAGIPVLGSRRGGLVELVSDEQDGLLVEPADCEAWAAAIERFVTQPGLRERLRDGVRAPRSMAEVASEMHALYHEVSVGTLAAWHV